jgi:hypothetical protein
MNWLIYYRQIIHQMRYKISEAAFNARAATFDLCIQIPERVTKDDCLYGTQSNEKHMKPRTDPYCNYNPDTLRKRSLTAHLCWVRVLLFVSATRSNSHPTPQHQHQANQPESISWSILNLKDFSRRIYL